MGELANCSRCGAVFVKTVRDICQDCYREEEESFQLVTEFLRDKKNREATMLEIVEATEVEEALIIKFIKEKRLSPTEFPKLAYPCERCGREITRGKICEKCQSELKDALAHIEKEEQLEKERKAKEQKSIYFTINKDES